MANLYFFNNLKEKLANLARSPRGLYLMTFICFLEPIFLPMIPELIVGPMLLARKNERSKILFFALLGTLIGSVFTYAFGYFLGQILISWLTELSLDKLYYVGLEYIETYGTFLPFIVSLTPIPLKMVTWSCGIARFNVFIYAGGIVLGRLARYSLFILFTPVKKDQSDTSLSSSFSVPVVKGI